MNLTNPIYNKPTRSINWRRLSITGGVIVLFTPIMLVIIFYFTPPGQRWAADQTAASPIVGVAQIDVVADDVLNHIFSPAVTQVKAGTEVTWHFKDIEEDGQMVAHNVVFEDEASPVLDTGTFSKLFEEPGTYQYTCTLHPFMDGVVIVTE